MQTVTCVHCKEKFELLPATVAKIKGEASVRSLPLLGSQRAKAEPREVAIVINMDINELQELDAQAEEMGCTVEEFIVSAMQNYT